MSDTDTALTLPWDSAKTSLVLTRETTKAWPTVQPIFADGGFFPNGLTIHSPKPIASSADATTVTGATTIDFASFTHLYALGDVGADLMLKEIHLSADPWRGA